MSGFTHQGVVYFVGCGKYVKIGYSAGNLDTRIQGLLNGIIVPGDLDRTQPLHLLHTIPGCIMRDERRIQALFAAHHVAGEWYRLNPAFLRHLSGLRYVTDAEVLARFRAARRELKRTRLHQVAA